MTEDRARVDPPRGEREWLPLLAFAIVLLSLTALAAIPALVLQRISRVNEGLNSTVLPAQGALREYALATERHASAARGRFLAAGSEPARLTHAREAEAAALQTLERLAPRLGQQTPQHLAEVRGYATRRDSLEAALLQRGPRIEEYRASLPRFDALQDSILMHLDFVERDVVRLTDARLGEEARAVRTLRSVSFALAGLALLAALGVGWFAWTQRSLRREVQAALAEATRLRDESERRREELEQATESRRRLLRGFSHDVKNPLGAAHGYLQLMADGVPTPLPEGHRRSVARADASVMAALGLVEDLLEIARAETGHLVLVPEPVDLATLAAEVAEEHRGQAEGKGLTLAVDPSESVPQVVTDARRVRQVLGNLVSNAVKYTRQGEVRIGVEATSLPTGMGGPGVAVTVADTGPGIPAEKHHLLFQEFVRLDPGSEAGAGVGLAISHRIARVLGGDITVESATGEGSRFTLWIPVDRREGERRDGKDR